MLYTVTRFCQVQLFGAAFDAGSVELHNFAKCSYSWQAAAHLLHFHKVNCEQRGHASLT